MNHTEKYPEKENLIQPLYGMLSEEGQKKIAEMLTFGEDLKAKGEAAKKAFWSEYDRYQFLDQIKAMDQKREAWLEEHQQKLQAIGFFDRGAKKQEKFIDEYIKLLLLYEEVKESEGIKYETIFWDEVMETGFREGVALDFMGNNIGAEGAKALAQMELKDGVYLDFMGNNIGAEGAKALAQMELKDGVTLNLRSNKIGDEGAKALAQMELKEGVRLNLSENNIGAEGAKALAQMELKDGVGLRLQGNNIGAEGAKALAQMELKDGVRLYLEYNNIGAEGKEALRDWVEKAKARGIDCKVCF